MLNKVVNSLLRRVLVCLFFLIPTIWFYIVDPWLHVDNVIVLSILRFFILFLLFEVVEIVQKKWLKWMLILILFPSFFTDIVFFYAYKSAIDTSGVMALFNTTYSESQEFTSLYVGVYIVIIACYFSFSFLYIRFSKTIFQLKKLSFKVLFIVSTLLAVILVTENYYLVKVDKFGRGHVKHFKNNVVEQYPFNFYYRLYEYQLHNRKLNKYMATVDSYSFNASIKSPQKSQDNEVIILVIGETQRSDLYLDELERQKSKLPTFLNDQVAIYPRMYSTGNSTAYCIPLIITRATAKEYDISYHEPSLLNLFKEVGYKTYWLANQNLFNGPKGANYKKNVDEFYPLWQKEKSDLDIVNYLKAILEEDVKKKFIVINLEGNHYKYDYPVEFELYKPSLESEGISVVNIANKEAFFNSYNNTSAYQLNVLNEMHTALNSSNSNIALMFSSDHGESLFESPHHIFGHGSSFVPIEQVHTFSYFWWSKGYKDKYPSKVDNLRANSDKFISADNIFYSVADLANLSYKNENLSHSACSDKFEKRDTLSVIVGETIFNFDINKYENGESEMTASH